MILEGDYRVDHIGIRFSDICRNNFYFSEVRHSENGFYCSNGNTYNCCIDIFMADGFCDRLAVSDRSDKR